MSPKTGQPFFNGLKKVPEGKLKDLQKVRSWMATQPHLPEISDEYIYLFLHSCFYSIDKTKATIENYFSIRSNHPEIFGNRDCEDPKVKTVRSLGVAAYSVHPEKLRQIFKARDARSVCNLITSEEYMKRINSALQKRILKNDQILTTTGTRHVINCAQPERKKRRRRRRKRRSLSESDVEALKAKARPMTAMEAIRGAKKQPLQAEGRRPWVPLKRFLNIVEAKSGPTQPKTKAIRYKIRTTPHYYQTLTPSIKDNEGKIPVPAPKLENEVIAAPVSRTRTRRSAKTDDNIQMRPTAYGKNRYYTRSIKDDEDESLRKSLASETSELSEVVARPTVIRRKKPRIFDTGSYDEERTALAKSLKTSPKSLRSSLRSSLQSSSLDESLEATKSLSDRSVASEMNASDAALVKAREYDNRMSRAKRQETSTARESENVSEREAANPQNQQRQPQLQGSYPFGYPGYFTVSASRQAFDALHSKSKAKMNFSGSKPRPMNNLDIDDVTQAVEGKKDMKGYWSSFENRWRQIREQNNPQGANPQPPPPVPTVYNSPSIISDEAATVSYRSESAGTPVETASPPSIDENPFNYSRKTAVVMTKPPKPKRKRRRTLLVDDVLILFNRVKLDGAFNPGYNFCAKITKNELQNMFMVKRHLLRLPKLTPEGYRVVLYSVRDNDPTKMNFSDCIKTFCMFNDIVLSEDGIEEGYVVIFDMKGVQLGHLARVSLPALRCFFLYIQEAHPVRIKSVHVLNTASWIHHVMRIVIPLVKSELISMVKFHRGNIPEGFPLDIMPMDYGGDTSSIDDLDKVTDSMWEKYRPWLLENEEYKSDESKRIVKKSAWWGFGLFGRANEDLDEKSIIKNLRYE